MENIALITIKFPGDGGDSSQGPHPETDRPTPPSPPTPALVKQSTVAADTEQVPSLGVKFVSAGVAACMADMATFPLDTAKVRLQVGVM
jgi:hypothetical protein